LVNERQPFIAERFPAAGALAAHCEHVDIYQPKEGSLCFSVHLHPKRFCKGEFTAAFGHTLRCIKI